MSSFLSLESIGYVASLLSTTLYQGNTNTEYGIN